MENLLNIFESTNINLLVGAGLSKGAYKTLEMKYTDESEYSKFINEYYEEKDIDTMNLSENEFYDILKQKHFNYEAYIDLLNDNAREIAIREFKNQFLNKSQHYDNVLSGYIDIFSTIDIMISNKDENKLVNIFTSNYDMLINEALYKLSLSYNDGFYKENIYSTDILDEINAIKDINGNIKEISHYNLVKFHGSLDWEAADDDLIRKKNIPFDDNFVGIMPSYLKYNNLLFSYTYYELLNKLKEALSIENSTLFIIGFSIRDEHIKKIIRKSLKMNKTLKIIYISYGNKIDEFIKDFNKDKKFIVIKPELYEHVDSFDITNVNKFFKNELEACTYIGDVENE